MRPIWMENIIKPKRLTFAEEIGVLSITIIKPHDVNLIKFQLVKMIKIKIDMHDVAAIISQIEVAINTKSLQDKKFVNDKTLICELRPEHNC